MKNTFSYIRTITAVLLAGAMIVACTMNDMPDNGPKTYSVTINAGSAQTKALDFNGSPDPTTALKATWKKDDVITLYNTTKSAALTGELTALEPKNDGLTVTFKGTVSGTIDKDDVLELRYNYHGFSAYSTQDGRLNGTPTSAEKFDYATATVKVKSTEGNNLTFYGDASFQTKTCVVMLEITDGTNPWSVTELTLSCRSQILFTFNPTAGTYSVNGPGVLYFALPSDTEIAAKLSTIAGYNVPVSSLGYFTFTFSSGNKSCNKSGYPFEAGKYYKATLALTN